MRLAIAQPGAQSVTAMGLIAPVYASGLPWPVRAGAAVGHRAVAFADALHWRARAQPAGEMLAVDCGRGGRMEQHDFAVVLYAGLESCSGCHPFSKSVS